MSTIACESKDRQKGNIEAHSCNKFAAEKQKMLHIMSLCVCGVCVSVCVSVCVVCVCVCVVCVCVCVVCVSVWCVCQITIVCLSRTHRISFVTLTHCVHCEVRTESVSIMYTDL